LQSKSTESHGSKEGKKFCRDMFPRFNEIPEPFALRAREYTKENRNRIRRAYTHTISFERLHHLIYSGL